MLMALFKRLSPLMNLKPLRSSSTRLCAVNGHESAGKLHGHSEEKEGSCVHDINTAAARERRRLRRAIFGHALVTVSGGRGANEKRHIKTCEKERAAASHSAVVVRA